jgi:hypothetical protein
MPMIAIGEPLAPSPASPFDACGRVRDPVNSGS